MGTTRYVDGPSEVGRIHGTPPLVGGALLGDTQVARPWPQLPFAEYTRPMRHHVIAGVFRGDGSTAFRVGGRQHRQPSVTGTTIINPKGHEGWWDCPGAPVVSTIFLGEDRLLRCAEELGRGDRPELLLNLKADDPRLFAILDLIAFHSRLDDAISGLTLEYLIELLCLQLLRGHVAAPAAAPNHRGGLSPAQLRRVTDYMRGHLGEAIQLQDLADLARLSRFHFCRAFRHSTGCAPHQWLVRLRLGRAADLLADDSLGVTDIALAVGYQTPSSFALAFRKVFGVSPTAYRRTRS